MTVYNTSSSILLQQLPLEICSYPNSCVDYFQRGSGRLTNLKSHINGNNGSFNVNAFKITGSIVIINQWAKLYDVNTLNNCTGVYSDLWDGTNSVLLTANGADLSGFVNGSVIIKDSDVSDSYTVLNADQCRMHEPPVGTRKLHYPFFVLQKYNTDTYVRFNYSTTDAPVDFCMDIYFEWKPMDGGCLEVV